MWISPQAASSKKKPAPAKPVDFLRTHISKSAVSKKFVVYSLNPSLDCLLRFRQAGKFFKLDGLLFSRSHHSPCISIALNKIIARMFWLIMEVTMSSQSDVTVGCGP